MRIKLRHLTQMLILVALAMVISTNAGASNLSGKVTDVLDGGTFTLLSLNKSIKVRLLAVAPPEKKQPYAEVARKHLAELLLGKYVVVRYTGLGEGHYLNGRVLLDQADIGAQMLRDGVAWYDKSDASDLSEAERQLYTDCELAARNERLGVWQDANPKAPWDYKSAIAVASPEVNKASASQPAPVRTPMPEYVAPSPIAKSAQPMPSAGVETTICEGLKIPDGYVIAGRTTESGCAKGAWILKRKGSSSLYSATTDLSVATTKNYDRFQDRTVVRMGEVLLFREPRRSEGTFDGDELYLSAAFAYRGDEPRAPESVKLFFRIRGLFAEISTGSDSVIFLADGQRIVCDNLDRSYKADAKENQYGGYTTYDVSTVGVTVSLGDFIRIIKANNVEVRLGQKEFSLNTGGLSSLRGFSNYMVLGR